MTKEIGMHPAQGGHAKCFGDPMYPLTPSLRSILRISYGSGGEGGKPGCERPLPLAGELPCRGEGGYQKNRVLLPISLQA